MDFETKAERAGGDGHHQESLDNEGGNEDSTKKGVDVGVQESKRRNSARVWVVAESYARG